MVLLFSASQAAPSLPLESAISFPWSEERYLETSIWALGVSPAALLFAVGTVRHYLPPPGRRLPCMLHIRVLALNYLGKEK